MANGNGDGNGKMSGASWVVAECLAMLAGFGLYAILHHEQALVLVIVTAVVGVLNNERGARSGSKVPEQIGTPGPGQTGETKTETTSTTKTEAPATPPVTP